MMKRIAALALFTLIAACAVTGTVFGPTPEAQIVNGANSVKAAATIASTLLRNDKITVTQAKGYRAILGTASEHLDAANGTLVACRKKTASTSASNPDPCAPGVAADISLALSVVSDVQKTLKAKE